MLLQMPSLITIKAYLYNPSCINCVEEYMSFQVSQQLLN